MPAIQPVQHPNSRQDQMANRIQELKARAAESLEDAMNVVEQNLGRREADEATLKLKGLPQELSIQEAAMHYLEPSKVADLISDPFED